MGLAGYYQRYIEGFLKIANPITELQKKNKKFVWTEKCTEAFWRLKELLTTTPILKVPDMDHYGLHHIFMQSDLNVRQRHWLELLSEYDFKITYIEGTMN
jgi:hypothetical protein